MRCEACPAIMTGKEIGREQPDGSPETMCTKCLIASGVLLDEEITLYAELAAVEEYGL